MFKNYNNLLVAANTSPLVLTSFQNWPHACLKLTVRFWEVAFVSLLPFYWNRPEWLNFKLHLLIEKLQFISISNPILLFFAFSQKVILVRASTVVTKIKLVLHPIQLFQKIYSHNVGHSLETVRFRGNHPCDSSQTENILYSASI